MTWRTISNDPKSSDASTGSGTLLKVGEEAEFKRRARFGRTEGNLGRALRQRQTTHIIPINSTTSNNNPFNQHSQQPTATTHSNPQTRARTACLRRPSRRGGRR